MPKFAIKHTPTGKYANLTFRGLDAINLGWNPKLYDTHRLAEIDLEKIDSAIQHNHNVLDNTEIGTDVHVMKQEHRDRITVKVTLVRTSSTKISRA
jgi:hypothetical protein